MTLRALADRALSLLLAPPCAACARTLGAPLDGPVCDECWSRLPRLTPPFCDPCGTPLPSWRVAAAGGGRCPRCRRSARAVDRARAVGPYEGSLRAVLHALKYDGRESLATRLGARLRECGSELLDGADAAVPVPLHARRRRARGFNQADLLARTLGLPVWRVLYRVADTPPQSRLPAARRHGNVRGAFRLALPGLAPHFSWIADCGGLLQPSCRESTILEQDGAVGAPPRVSSGAGRLAALGEPRQAFGVEGRTLVLVDDVATTGATLDACARVLKEAGAREVRALTAARAVSRRP